MKRKRLTTDQKNRTVLAALMSERRVQIDRLILQIQAGVDATVDDHKANPTNWGYAGNLGHVMELLNEAATFMGKPGVK